MNTCAALLAGRETGIETFVRSLQGKDLSDNHLLFNDGNTPYPLKR
jgi:hypothetical protein